MTLNVSGPIGLGSLPAGQSINGEFSLANNATFPGAFYGKGGAPASGPLSFADFYGRSNAHSASLAPDPVSGGSSGSGTIDVGTAICTVTGGVGPFTYSCVKVGGATITALTPTVSSTNFRATGMSPGEQRQATFRYDVTDTGNGNLVVSSNAISVEIERFP